MTDTKNCNNCRYGRHMDDKGEIVPDKVFCNRLPIFVERVAPDKTCCAYWEADHTKA